MLTRVSSCRHTPAELDLYARIFRCESCSAFTARDGVASFAARGPEQTIPVSHFGNISRSPLWLILNNPKGDRLDPAVSTSPRDFRASARADLSGEAIASIKTHFDEYFQPGSPINEFFNGWIRLLDGIRLNGQILTFSGGSICAVDLIKCPTRSGWMGYVMTPEGKRVWDNCLRYDDGNRFLLRQIDLHRPRVLVFAGTQNCVGSDWRGTADREMNVVVRSSDSVLNERNILEYLEMCRREGTSLQQGMNYGLGGNHSVILMSVRRNAPYRDRLEDEALP
jgi:hypothetical protein